LTPQEEQLLNSLVGRVNQTQLQEKDPDAEALLNSSLGSNPDALYILAQTILVQNIALEQAKAQVTQLQQQAQRARQPVHATSFLGSLLGRHDPDPPPAPQQPAYQPVNPQYIQPQYTQPSYAPAGPQYQQTQYVPSGPPSFLRGAMQTAAGVAAGALAFEGVEAVLHGLGGHPGYGWGGGGLGMGGGLMGAPMGTGFDRPVEETVVNNYYDDPNAQGGERQGLERGGSEQGGEHHFHESADQGGAQLTDASYNTTGDDRNEIDANNIDANNADVSQADDSANFDNSGFDSNVDDGSGFDDSGGGFDGGGDSGGDLL
jgi:uncharacterized protein